MGVRVLKVQRKDMKISITVNETKLTATIFDSPSARDFLSMLPLNLALENYASNERICHLPRKLTTSGSGTFANEAIGDLAYYAPWGNLVFYYGPYRYSNGLIRLGKLDDDLAPMLADGVSGVRIESFPDLSGR